VAKASKVWPWLPLALQKAKRRQQCQIVTTSIGPGALNVVTAAGVALANRLPLLILSGDTFNSQKSRSSSTADGTL